MQNPLDSISFIALTFIIFGVVIFNLLYVSFLLKVRGTQYRKEITSPSAIHFSTRSGDFRLNKTHHSLAYKTRGGSDWVSISLDEITGITAVASTDDAKLLEFLFGGWSILNLYGKYRDVVNTLSIELKVANNDNVVLTQLKQYQQRDWFLSQIFNDLYVYILRKLNMYHTLDEAGLAWQEMISQKFEKYGVLSGK